MTHGWTHQRQRRRWAALTSAFAALVASVSASTPSAGASDTGFPPPDTSMLTRVNWYRSQSGLGPVVNRGEWQTAAEAHSCWMLRNGISHEETPGTPGFTLEGQRAGRNGNVAVSSGTTPNGEYVDLWMTGPFHAIGILREGLREVGEGRCDSANPFPGQVWRSAATLDVLRGLVSTPRRGVFFPGDGSVTHLRRFIAETPDPRSFCGWGGEDVGLPLIAMLPSAPANTTASVDGPQGPLEVCVLTAANTSGSAASILGGDNAVVVMPRTPLVDGVHRVRVSTSNGTVAWSFTVADRADTRPATAAVGEPLGYAPMAPVRIADTRIGVGLTQLPARVATRLQVAGTMGVDPAARAVSINYTVTGTTGPGFLSVFPCGPVPNVSTTNWGSSRETVTSGTISVLDVGGGVCLYATSSADIVVDVNGVFAPGKTGGLTPTGPTRALDTRHAGPAGRLAAGEITALPLAGSYGVAADASGVAVNLTAVGAERAGFITAFPCGSDVPVVSNLNMNGPAAVANAALVPLGGGALCVYTSVDTDLVVDVTGSLGAGGSLLQPVLPVRLVDTRLANYAWSAGAMMKPLAARGGFDLPVAGRQGLPARIDGVVLNVTSTDTAADGFITVHPTDAARPEASTSNPARGRTVANTVHVRATGGVSIYTMTSAHLVVDAIAVWVPRQN